ncbi:Protein BONZAI 3 [Sarracenia purpurea var. burkii]
MTQVCEREWIVLFSSDPIAVVYAKKRDGSLEELGRTEVIMNSLDPVWIEKINVAYQFEIVQLLIFHVYDVDTRYHNVPVKNVKFHVLIFSDAEVERSRISR